MARFTPIAMNTWPRREPFHSFARMAPTGYSLTAEVDVSCLPWVSFRHFAVHSYDCKSYYLPSVEAGRFEERAGRTLLPLPVTCHHAATDGWHEKGFFEQLQQETDSFESRLTGL